MEIFIFKNPGFMKTTTTIDDSLSQKRQELIETLEKVIYAKEIKR